MGEEIEMENVTKHSIQTSCVSYMSNNTMILNELHSDPLLVNESDNEMMDCLDEEEEEEDKVLSKNMVIPPPIFAQRKESNIFDGDEDEIIKSPIELNKNMSFGIRAN